ncbi:calcium uniporter protein, mitochondrial-like [Protopterus annectens]|uniref:calcium uniporter protein, mitochondrial-like n=1 Tax=Protopterus annectens TaxID=7888 RepID=UPI001CFA5B5A|nr:calcium uniporter protein, mitochondrial-like [Protopterus annectens]
MPQHDQWERRGLEVSGSIYLRPSLPIGFYAILGSALRGPATFLACNPCQLRDGCHGGRSSLVVLLSRSSSCGVLTGGFPGLGSRQQQRRTATGQRSYGRSYHHLKFCQQASKAHQRRNTWQSQRFLCSNTVVPSEEVAVTYQNGLPVISVNLPSRRERCQFTLKPLSDSVGVFLKQLQAEDRGIDRVAIYSTDGTRIASSTGIDILLLDDFNLVINDNTYTVHPPKREILSHEDSVTMNDVKMLIQQLYSTLRIEEHQLQKERELIERLEDLQAQLKPLEQARDQISRKAQKRTTWVLWGGMAYMATQFGILARLTWWEYSWDIMEPVTYFITYGSAMAMYAYFVLTRQEYIYPDARDRQFLLFFHKGAKKTKFDIEKYNQLKDAISQFFVFFEILRFMASGAASSQSLFSTVDEAVNVGSDNAGSNSNGNTENLLSSLAIQIQSIIGRLDQLDENQCILRESFNMSQPSQMREGGGNSSNLQNQQRAGLTYSTVSLLNLATGLSNGTSATPIQ